MLTKFMRFKFSSRSIPKAQLDKLGISNTNILRNLSTADLYEIALLKNKPADPLTRVNTLAESGALIAYSGLKTG